MPRSSAIPRIRACIAAKVPSACHRCNQRCVALFDPHWGPCGTSHQRPPVIKMYNKVFRIFRNGAWGIPRLRFGGAGGKTSSNKRHSKSLTPSNRPAILPSYVQIEQYSTKIILVGYIRVCWPTSFSGISSAGWKKKHQRLRSRRSAGYWQWCCPSKSSRRMRSYGTWPACNSVITVPISRTGKGAFTRYLVK